MKRCIEEVYNDMDLTCETFPSDTEVDPAAYIKGATGRR